MSHEPTSCWVISDGRRGIENQALGLAEALACLRPLNITAQTIQTDGLMKTAQPNLQFTLKSTPEDYGLTAPFPDIAIGCGRQAIAPLRALKKAKPAIFTVYIQNPRINTKHFDLVIAPQHDNLKGKTVVTMIGSPNRITQDRLIIETLQFSRQLEMRRTPRVAVLIGGTSKTHELDRAAHAAHMSAVHTVLAQKMSAMITTSRRTPDWARAEYRALAASNEHIWYWAGDGSDAGENPYFAFLGAADAILVTQDSTNMLTEACSTGKPVFTLPMKGKPGKFKHLYESLAKHCNVREFTGVIDDSDYTPLAETQRAAQHLNTLLD